MAPAAAPRMGVTSVVDGDAALRVVVRRAAETATLWCGTAGSSAVFRSAPVGTVEVLSGRLALGVGATEQHLDTGDTMML